MTAKPFHVEITGKRRDTETVMRRLEGAIGKVLAMVTRWSPTLPHEPVLRRGTSNVTFLPGGKYGDVFLLPDAFYITLLYEGEFEP